MYSYTKLRNLFGKFTKNTDAGNLTYGDELIDNAYRFIMAKMDWLFLEKTVNLDTIGTIPLTFNAVFAGGETTGTLTTAFAYDSGQYNILFSNGETISAKFEFGSTTVTFNTALVASATATASVVGQQFIKMPADCLKPKTVVVILGNVRYTPIEITDQVEWERQNRISNIKSNIPIYYFIKGKTSGGKEIGFYPTPAGANTNVIELTYKKQVKSLNIADYITGTIATATQGSRNITGAGTSWNASMIGRFIIISETATANGGDGIAYEIESVTDTTHLTLVTPYIGASIATGSASYTIFSSPLLPLEFQLIPVYKAAHEYWLTIGNDATRATEFKSLYVDHVKLLEETYGSKSSNIVLQESNYEKPLRNPNNYPIS